MGIVYIMPDPGTGIPPFYANIIEFSPGSPPPRPHPEPDPPRPTHPIFYPPGTDPGQPHPEHPIYYPPGTGPGVPPIPPIEPPVDPGQTVTAIIVASETPVPPPAAFPSDAVSVKMWHGKGTVQYDWWLPKAATTKPTPPGQGAPTPPYAPGRRT